MCLNYCSVPSYGVLSHDGCVPKVRYGSIIHDACNPLVNTGFHGSCSVGDSIFKECRMGIESWYSFLVGVEYASIEKFVSMGLFSAYM